MRITLLNPRLKTWSPSVYVPLGLCYIAAILEKEGYTVGIIDLNLKQMNDKNLLERLAGVDVVGLTGMITEHEEIKRLSRLIKKRNRELLLVLGGPLATTIPEELLRESPADFVVMGEGEDTIVKLLSAIKKGNGFEGIDGIAYKKNGQIVINPAGEPIEDPDTIPFPARHLLDMERYVSDQFRSFGIKVKGLGRIRSTNLISSRGCPYSCTFCFKGMWGRKWRGRSPENIIEEMENLYNDYGVNGFLFNDDTFVLDEQRVHKFCRLLREKELKIAWYCNGRINLMTREMLAAMYDSGCRGIAYGIESGNQKILDSMKKQVTLDQVRQVVKWTKEVGINTTGYFMIGMLGETRKTILETLAFAKELDLDFYGFSLTTPFIGTELYDAAKEAGIISGIDLYRGEWSLNVNVNLTRDCSDSDLIDFESIAFRDLFLKKRFGKYYLMNPGFLKEEAKILLSLRNGEQAKEIAKKVRNVLGTYVAKR